MLQSEEPTNDVNSNLTLVSQIAKAFFQSPEPPHLDDKNIQNGGGDLCEFASPEELNEIQSYLDLKRLGMKRRANDEIFVEDNITTKQKDKTQETINSETDSKTEFAARKMEKLKVMTFLGKCNHKNINSLTANHVMFSMKYYWNLV